MEIEKLDNGQFALKIPLQAKYIHVGIYEPRAAMDKKNDILTKDMTIMWQVKYGTGNEAIDSATGMVLDLIRTFGNCLDKGLYKASDIRHYLGMIYKQEIYQNIIAGKRYYECKQFWIEIYYNQIEEAIPAVCFPADRLKNKRGEPLTLDRKLEANEAAYFILDKNTKYIILEIFRILAAINIENKEFSINELNRFYIKYVFELDENEYNLDQKDGSIRISPRPKTKTVAINAVNDYGIFSFYNMYFKNCIFKCGISLINMNTDRTLKFIGCTFKNNVEFYGIFRDIIYFIDSTFKEQVSFKDSRFMERIQFKKATFEKLADFSSVIFEHNAYFDEAEFLGEAKFKQSEFYMNAHFYGTKFKEVSQGDNITMNDIPNFLQIILNGYINLTNTKQLLLSFEQLKSIIDRNNEKEKDDLANEFRNTFRNFKNGLIKDNNTIDASQFHKMELYAKELEINYKKEKAAKDWAEKFQLMFYRLTSDHHTDLLLILNNVIFLIVSFGIVIYYLFYHADYSTICTDVPYCFLKEKYLISPTLLEYICPNCTLSNIFHWEVSSIIATCFIFVVFFMLASWIFYCINAKNKYFGLCFILLYSLITFILAVKPAIMLPIFGKLIDESLKVDFPAFTSLSVVYAILMFLLIWSLQKTARKNTIVPN